MKIRLASPRGFCAGVERAIEIVNRALELYGAPVYVKHEVVHNRTVVEELRAKGARFIEDLAEVPDGTHVIFSAHGVSQEVRRTAEERGLQVLDATCPLVTKVHFEVLRNAREGRECILIGHAGHPEVEGTLGQYERGGGGEIYLVESEEDARTLRVKDPQRLSYVTQTTLSLDDTRRIIAILQERFPALDGPRRDDICYATQNRQDAVRDLSAECDLVLVVGSANSSNSNRLREVAERSGVPAYLIENAAAVDRAWLSEEMTVGVTAGASVPEFLVREVVALLQSLGASPPEETEDRREEVSFSLPRELRIVD